MTLDQIKESSEKEIKNFYVQCFPDLDTVHEEDILYSAQALATYCEDLYKETEDPFYLERGNVLRAMLRSSCRFTDYGIVASYCYETAVRMKRRLSKNESHSRD